MAFLRKVRARIRNIRDPTYLEVTDTYRIDENDYQGNKVIQRVVISNSVFSIYPRSFKDCTSLVEINIPNCINYIGNDVLKGCTSLQKIYVPNFIGSYGYRLMFGTKILFQLQVPTTLKYLNNNTFIPSEDESFLVPHGFEEIFDGAFRDCLNFKIIIIPNSIKTIEYNAFMGCS